MGRANGGNAQGGGVYNHAIVGNPVRGSHERGRAGGGGLSVDPNDPNRSGLVVTGNPGGSRHKANGCNVGVVFSPTSCPGKVHDNTSPLPRDRAGKHNYIGTITLVR
jgi:hypothetical protein